MENNTFKIISEFLEFHFKSKRTQFNKAEIEHITDLMNLGVLDEIKTNNEIFEIDPYSIELQKAIHIIAEKKLNKQIPLDVLGAFKFIDEFDEFLRKEYKTNVINAFDVIIKGHRVYILNYLSNNGIDIKEFIFSSYNENDDENYNKLYFFERSLFKFLPSSNYSEKDIFEIISKLNSNKHSKGNIITGLREFPKYNMNKSISLLEYSFNNTETKDFSYELMIGIYNEGYYDILDKVIKLKFIDYYNCLFVLGRLKYNNKNDIERVFNLIGDLDFENKEIAQQQSYFISNIIENAHTPSLIRDNAFRLYADFLAKASDEIKHIVFQDIHYLKDNEAKKYSLLRLYLLKTQNFNAINNFFYYSKDPRYIFDLMIELFRHTPNYQFNVKLFDGGIRHLWNTNKDETESEILNLFKQHPAYGILAVSIILSPSLDIYKVDLLKLDMPEYQINAIKSICKHPFSFDKLLLLILPLRDSKHKEVRQFLQAELARKVFTSYHDAIFKLISNNVTNNRKDKEFIKPIKLALEDYYKLKKLKESINDLNPNENEKDLMELYYRLEHEEKTKMMSSIQEGKGTFMEFAKSSIIVRGNSVKYDNKEPTPLARIESSYMIDGSSFLNPDLFEHNLNVLE